MGMCEDSLGKWEVERHEEGGPVDAVESHDVFPDDLAIGRPAPSMLTTWGPGIARLCDVVHEGIKPYVNGLGFVLRDADAPMQALRRARYGEVVQTGLNSLDDLAHAVRRGDPVWILFEEAEKRLSELR